MNIERKVVSRYSDMLTLDFGRTPPLEVILLEFNTRRRAPISRIGVSAFRWSDVVSGDACGFDFLSIIQ